MTSKKVFTVFFENNLSEPVSRALYDKSRKNSHAVVSIKKDQENNAYLDIRRKSKKWCLAHGVFLNKNEIPFVFEKLFKDQEIKTKINNNEIEIVILKTLKSVKIRKRYIPEEEDKPVSEKTKI